MQTENSNKMMTPEMGANKSRKTKPKKAKAKKAAKVLTQK